jgi:hypothetical protein
MGAWRQLMKLRIMPQLSYCGRPFGDLQSFISLNASGNRHPEGD